MMEKLRLQLGCRGGDDAQCEALKVFCLHAAGFDLTFIECHPWAAGDEQSRKAYAF